MVYCKNCGSEVPTEDVCPKCGTVVETEQEEVFETSVIEDSSFEAEVYDSTPAVDPGKGKGIAALLFGIISIVFTTVCCLTCCGFGSLVTSIIGMVLGSSAKKTSAAAGFKNGKAKTGFILSLVSLIITILVIIAVLIYLIFLGGSGMISAAVQGAMYS